MLAEYPYRIAQRTSRIHRIAVLGALGALAGLVFLLTRSEHPQLVFHHDSRLGVSARVPPAWHIQAFDNNVGLATHTGFVVSNVAHTFTYPDLTGGRSTSGWDMTELPSYAVVVEISRVVRLDVACNSGEENMTVTNFPLSLEDPGVVRARRVHGSPPRHYIGVCLRNGENFGIHTWLFPEASLRDSKLARELIASIRPSS
jgi:hypothetical protein